MIDSALFSPLILESGNIPGSHLTRRHLADLAGSFADAVSYEQALAAGNPVVYTVAAAEPGQGSGDLHYGLGRLMPGRIGSEYFLTKGHYHAWRDACEVYVGLGGEGVMLLEDEAGESRLLPLKRDCVVYVPGRTAHRTVNTGAEPLVYLGIYPASAGHDYAPISERNFRNIVVERNGRPQMLDRSQFQL